jgi:glycosyltransferase involved in cell wall biosynthesis
MKISIIVNGRFHFYDLARELSFLNHDVRLVSTLPKFYIKKRTKLHSSKIDTFTSLEVFKRIIARLKLYNIRFDIFQKKVFSYFCFFYIDKSTDALVFFAGNGWFSKSLSAIKKDLLLIADEGSAHPCTVNDLLNAEYKRIGLKRNATTRKILDNETNDQYKIADYVVVPSTFVMRSLISNGVAKEKIFVNPYGVDVETFCPSSERSLGSKFRIMFCGLFSIQKGSHILLQIASYFEKKNNDIEFIHVGGIDAELRELLTNSSLSNFKHYDPVQQEELPKFYNSSDVFILPSIQDGFAMVVLQAMACGLPVICSQNSCGHDIIDHGIDGFVVDPVDLQSYINYINLLYDNKLFLSKIKLLARNKVIANFTWQMYAKRYSDFLDDIKFI